ncbi:hypothetical protein C8Q80DRAFT_269077 [Daedaleopsis nitida]|nr:hypothetical protein C8Q80DRAFT_269077 [Daedaleopsis nitida]
MADQPNVGKQSAFIHTLPHETLLEIFFHARESWALPWAPFLWVCCRWSEIVRGTPTFWQEVNIYKKPRMNIIRMCLQYTHTSPFDVSFWDTADFTTPLSLLEPHVSRVRTLRIERIKNPMDPALATLLSYTMPSIQRLHVSFVPPMPHFNGDVPSRTNEEDTVLFSWTPRIHQFPNITQLSLGRAVSIHGPMPVYPTLKRLELHDFLPAPFDLLSFIEFVSQHPHLEELSIRKYRPDLVAVTQPLCLPPTILKLTMEDNAHYAKPFLSSFYIPPHVQVSLTRALDYIDNDDIDEHDLEHEFEDWEDEETGSITEDIDAEHDELLKDITISTSRGLTVTKVLPDNRDLLPILKLVTSIELHRDLDELHTLTGRTPAGNVVKISGKMYDHAERDLRENLHVLDDLVTVFLGAPVTELRVNGHGSSKLERRHWVRALRAFPDLERLSLEKTYAHTAWDARPALFSALRMKSRMKAHIAMGQEPGAVTALWPRLKSLTLLSDAMSEEDEEFADKIAECLRDRAAGGARLSELRIILTYMSLEQGGPRARKNQQRNAAYVTKLQHLVDNLHFDSVNTF